MELSDGFFHWVGETPELAEADFEVLGRAPRGMWGVSAWTPRFPKVAFTLGLGYDGELSAWRTTQATQDATSESTLLLLRRPVANWQMDGMNVLRATIRDGRAWVWVNGQETGPPIELPDPIPQSKINLLGYVDDAGSRCEFDSLRIWRPGEGPPPQLVQLPPRTPVAKPFFEHDFSDDDPPWLDEKVDLLAVRDGRFTMDNAGPNVWCFSSAVPALETADIEIPGRATDGCWGVFLTAQTFPKYGVAIALDREGRLTAWRSVQGQVETSPELTPLKIRTKSLTRWKADGFNLLRVCVAAGTAKVWVNGQVACELLELPDPLPLFKTWLIGGRGEGELHCQFESIRVWRAGQGPPPELGGTPGKPFFELDFINNPPEFLERDKSRLKLQDGRLAMHADRQWLWYHGSPETGSADVEVSVRPITGQWGVAAWTSGPDFPAVGLFLVLDGEGKLSVGHQNQPNAETPFSIDWPEIRRKPLERWKKDGFNTLRTTIRAGRAFVWVNGQEACEPIELPAPLPRFGVGFFGGNSENAHGEFDWIRVWRAGLRDWPTSSATR